MGRLGHAGATAPLRKALFPRGFGAEVMQLILETWKKFVPPGKLRLEDRITALFREALIKAYEASGRKWFVTLEDPIVDPTYGTQEGRNDLRFYPPRHHGQTVFFTVECKRLHVLLPPSTKAKQKAQMAGKPRPKPVFKHLAGDYVKSGMERFVVGQYSHGLPCGGMFAYVLDNQLDLAFDRICKAIGARRTKLRMKAGRPLATPSRALPTWRHSADTVHSRSDGDFLLHHLLVGVA